MRRLNSVTRSLLTFFSLLALIACEVDNDTTLVKNSSEKSSEIPKVEMESSTVTSQNIIPSDLIIFEDQRNPAWISSFGNAGYFTVEDNCLVFISKFSEKSATAIFPPKTNLTSNQDVLIFTNGKKISLNKEIGIRGISQPFEELQSGDVSPKIPEHCPKSFIFIGDP